MDNIKKFFGMYKDDNDPDSVSDENAGSTLENTLALFDKRSVSSCNNTYSDAQLPDYNAIINSKKYSGSDTIDGNEDAGKQDSDESAPYDNMYKDVEETVKEPIKYPISPESVGKGLAVGYFLANIFGKSKMQKALIFGSTALGTVAAEEYTKRKGLIK
jgi:hypothetical protein